MGSGALAIIRRNGRRRRVLDHGVRWRHRRPGATRRWAPSVSRRSPASCRPSSTSGWWRRSSPVSRWPRPSGGRDRSARRHARVAEEIDAIRVDGEVQVGVLSGLDPADRGMIAIVPLCYTVLASSSPPDSTTVFIAGQSAALLRPLLQPPSGADGPAGVVLPGHRVMSIGVMLVHLFRLPQRLRQSRRRWASQC